MRALIITKLFPNAADPLACPFNRQQFSALRNYCDVRVLATIPWFPGAHWFRRWSRAGKLSKVPKYAFIEGMRVAHPRYFYVPRIGHAVAGPLYAASVLPDVLPLRGRVDVVLGSWAYPDGYAAVLLSRALGVPAVVKLHGTDINVVAELPGARRAIGWALRKADAVVAVSRPLREKAIALGVAPERIELVKNGVDLELFRIRERQEARDKLELFGMPENLTLFVGRLEREKGVLDLLDAFDQASSRNPDLGLVLVGDGSARPACEHLAARMPGKILVAGTRPLDEVPCWMAACDTLVLPSWNEGTPNVVLEAFACGRRVVATNVGGIPDLVRAPELGQLVEPRRPAELAGALLRDAHRDSDPHRIRALAEVGDWSQSAERLYEVLEHAVARKKALASISQRLRPTTNPAGV